MDKLKERLLKVLRGQSVTKERKSWLVRLSVRQGDKDLFCNQQTIARKYPFSSPMESLEGKFSRLC